MSEPSAAGAELLDRLRAQPYAGYTYGYPHKTAYRRLEPEVELGPLWAQEDRSRVFGYLHLPFCEMRCGFCNLFTTANPADDLVNRYLAALQREATALREVAGPFTAARLAIGGGTPTYLAASQLERVLELLATSFNVTIGEIPTSIETSPATATKDRIRLLRAAGVQRISIGVQSFTQAEVHRIGRSQDDVEVRTALDLLRAEGPPVLNLDLMYGLPGQSAQSWHNTLTEALRWQPDELFCYPLYVRPLTGLGKNGQVPDKADQRLEHFRIAREVLCAAGYRMSSMRRFYRGTEPVASEEGRPRTAPDDEYSCQSDAMVGLGCGARSYTRSLHYSREYAVGRTGVRSIITDYLSLSEADLRVARHGFRLSAAERLRRYLLQSLLHVDGLDVAACQAEIGLDPWTLPLRQLLDAGLAGEAPDGRLRLTDAGLELSDAIGPLFYSAEVIALEQDYEPR